MPLCRFIVLGPESLEISFFFSFFFFFLFFLSNSIRKYDFRTLDLSNNSQSLINDRFYTRPLSAIIFTTVLSGQTQSSYYFSLPFLVCRCNFHRYLYTCRNKMIEMEFIELQLWEGANRIVPSEISHSEAIFHFPST